MLIDTQGYHNATASYGLAVDCWRSVAYHYLDYFVGRGDGRYRSRRCSHQDQIQGGYVSPSDEAFPHLAVLTIAHRFLCLWKRGYVHSLLRTRIRLPSPRRNLGQGRSPRISPLRSPHARRLVRVSNCLGHLRGR